MAFRSLPTMKVQSTSVAQPLAGSWITSGIGGPSNSPLTLTLGTATSAAGIQDGNGIFASGDWAWLIDPDGTDQEMVRIQSVSGNTVTLGPRPSVTVQGVNNPVTTQTHTSGVYGTGTFILLAINANNIAVSFEDGATGNWLYIGSDYRMTSDLYRIAKLAKVSSNVQPYLWSAAEYSPGGPLATQELWVLGTNTADKYSVSIMIP